MRVDAGAVVAERRWLAAAIVLRVAEVLGCRVGEGRTGDDRAGQRVAADLVERVTQPVLRNALREVAGWRPPALRCGGSESLLDLAAGGEAVLREPDRSARPFDAEHMA